MVLADRIPRTLAGNVLRRRMRGSGRLTRRRAERRSAAAGPGAPGRDWLSPVPVVDEIEE